MLNLPSCFRLAALAAFVGAFGVARAVAADSAKPTIFVIGDSTARNSAKGANGQPCLGWGTPLADFFDPAKVEVANVAHAGQSSRTYFLKDSDWPSVHPKIKAGDFVLLVFGINDVSVPRGNANARGSLPGIGDETMELKDQSGKVVETAHTYGWYMTQMANTAREKGAHVVLLTVTTRNIWTNPKATFRDAKPTAALPADYDPKEDRIERGTSNGQYTQWTKELGAKLHIPVLDLTNLCADRYEKMGREAVDKLYSDHNHTYVAGAQVVAESVVSGLKAFPDSAFVPLLSAKGADVPAADVKYVSTNAAR